MTLTRTNAGLASAHCGCAERSLPSMPQTSKRISAGLGDSAPIGVGLALLHSHEDRSLGTRCVLLLVVRCKSLPSAIGHISMVWTTGSGGFPLAHRSHGVAATM
jgi:hypothetical protein